MFDILVGTAIRMQLVYRVCTSGHGPTRQHHCSILVSSRSGGGSHPTLTSSNSLLSLLLCLFLVITAYLVEHQLNYLLGSVRSTRPATAAAAAASAAAAATTTTTTVIAITSSNILSVV